MAFQQKEWKNRLSENPTRRLLTPVDGSTPFQVDVTRAEGTIMQAGDPFNAANMNDLEQRIADGIGGGDENMAPIEENSESANPYTVDDLLIYEGQLYRVISAIAIGNSLVEGVNIEATTLSDEIKEVQNELTANGNRIYMDYHDGKYGYNTSPTRGADTFVPFNTSTAILVGTSSGNGSHTFNVTEYYPHYSELTSDSFIVQVSGVSTRVGAGNYYSDMNGGLSLSKSYNASTGIVTVTWGRYGQSAEPTAGTYTVWLVIPE